MQELTDQIVQFCTELRTQFSMLSDDEYFEAIQDGVDEYECIRDSMLIEAE